MTLCRLADRPWPLRGVSSMIAGPQELGVGDRETARLHLKWQQVSPCAKSNLFRIYRPSYIQRAPSAARRCYSLELGRINLVGSSAPLSAKLAKTKRLISYGGAAHDDA